MEPPKLLLSALQWVWEHWLIILVGGLAIAGVAALIPKSRSPWVAAVLKSISRLAMSVSIALALGIPAAFFGLVMGSMAILMALGPLLVGLCVWSCIPLFKLLARRFAKPAKPADPAAGDSRAALDDLG